MHVFSSSSIIYLARSIIVSQLISFLFLFLFFVFPVVFIFQSQTNFKAWTKLCRFCILFNCYRPAYSVLLSILNELEAKYLNVLHEQWRIWQKSRSFTDLYNDFRIAILPIEVDTLLTRISSGCSFLWNFQSTSWFSLRFWKSAISHILKMFNL